MFRAARPVMENLQRIGGLLKSWLRKTVTLRCPNLQELWKPLPALLRIPHPSDGSCASLDTLIKKSLVATERLRARVRYLRQDWFRHRIPTMRTHPDRLVFIDETSVKTNLTRLRGRSRRGCRLEMNAPFGAWGTQTFIAGLTHDSLIAPWVIKGAMDGEAFAAYIREVLVLELQPGTVVICDNLATHRNKDAAQALRDNGCWFLYLPPYSPDLNPIEMAFSKLKAHLRRIGARTFDQMFSALTEVCDLFTSRECWNYFCEAGYGLG
jgi:transposase